MFHKSAAVSTGEKPFISECPQHSSVAVQMSSYEQSLLSWLTITGLICDHFNSPAQQSPITWPVPCSLLNGYLATFRVYASAHLFPGFESIICDVFAFITRENSTSQKRYSNWPSLEKPHPQLSEIHSE